MFLFLDVASPIAEFHLINDKKIVDSIKITNKTDQKLSDLLIPTYLQIDNDYKLSKKLKKLIITIGPWFIYSIKSWDIFYSRFKSVNGFTSRNYIY